MFLREEPLSTLSVGLQVSGQFHGQDGVEQGGDERRTQAAHRPEHLEQQQSQRHTVLLQRQREPREKSGETIRLAWTFDPQVTHTFDPRSKQ